jgi:hypothetical protein
MRSSEQQNEYLERGRFGEGPESPVRKKSDCRLWLGLACFVIAAFMVGSLKVFQIGGHDALGFSLFCASILAVIAGIVLSVVGLFRMRSR